jgi:hypothetical protein
MYMKNAINLFIFLAVAAGIFFGYKWLKNPGNSFEKKSSTYAVVIGVSTYALGGQPGQVPNLRFCDDDASLFYGFLRSDAGGSVPEANISLLIDQQATKAAIINQLNEVFARSGPDDRVIFYFAGHGNNGVFAPYDLDLTVNSTSLFHKEIKGAFRKCRAKTRLCFADACRSGSMKERERSIVAASGQVAEEASTIERSLGDPQAGLVVLMATRPYQNAKENPNIVHGYFTKFLVDGLEGKADKNADQIVTIREVFDYLYQNLFEISKGKPADKGQLPVIFGDYDENMPLAHLKAA